MNVVGSGALHHTCFIVRDVEETAAKLAESFGWGPWSVLTIEPTESTLRGEPADFSFRIALADVGGNHYELLAPLAGESVYTEQLAERGEGFHHTALLYSTHEAMRQARSELVGQGRELVQSGVVGDVAEFAYFMIPELGSIVELLYIAEMPAPEATIG